MRAGINVLDRGVIKAIVLVCLADGIVGLSYGSLAAAQGFPLWVPIALSTLVLAGASEFLFIGIVAGGGSPLTAAAAGLLVNARHLPFGIAVKDLVGQGGRSLLGCHIMNDESVVFGISQPGLQQRRVAYWLCGLGIFAVWPLTVIGGAMIGRFIPDVSAIGLDAVFPAILIALIFPALRKRRTRIPALAGTALSVAVTPFVPAGMPVLFSLLGLLSWRERKDGQ
ncbi:MULTISPECIES: AzlC family ABC transporter permease [Pantoea]|jgi:4-azaleucine resistance transporter AzlC|uniref:AzlC family ABC transporter permease n=1 Tax=Pantoea eucrina TaxID=472693 RepID=A0ABS1ZBA4_9GAMM|nr:MULTISPECIES: AzlC family ABC transporter permease [Pantoea]AJA71198.1 branched-chain amino acid ABC transporter permease [Pantoea sp. PSNIH1]KAA6044394.1 branched-chain amino acid ABC transporter permease [Pantoea sp. Bo_7]KAA6090171.1 branched-chain amino acid ABC transporter permease [Pantoea sp. Bo_10]QNH53100.1 AzlC family ABC transporter permease [Acinetobacter venetianus]RAU33595.1 branched-chain amino acid ABC transporter permease [Pantoea sp. RIT 413]